MVEETEVMKEPRPLTYKVVMDPAAVISSETFGHFLHADDDSECRSQDGRKPLLCAL